MTVTELVVFIVQKILCTGDLTRGLFRHLKIGLLTFCFAIPGHLNIKNSKIDATEAYETR